MDKKLNQESTLREAKEWLRARLEKGEHCPCCGQLARWYVRKLYSSIAAALIFFYKNFEHDKFTHKNELIAKAKLPWLSAALGGGDFSKAALWGLIEEKPKDESDQGRTSGYWRLTKRGKDFICGKIKIQSHVRIYDGKVFGFTGDQVSITDCLGKKFSYAELMGDDSREK